jgi:hypothetical protein
MALVAAGGWQPALAEEATAKEAKGIVTVTVAGPCEMMFSDVHQQRYLTY